MQRHQESAQKIVAWLQEHDQVIEGILPWFQWHDILSRYGC